MPVPPTTAPAPPPSPATRPFAGSRTVVRVTRRLLDLIRTIPKVGLAFLLVWPFGIGPLAGIVAIAAHTTGALGKLFVELNENADQRPVEGIRSVGGSCGNAAGPRPGSTVILPPAPDQAGRRRVGSRLG